jgi:hypothetical protein
MARAMKKNTIWILTWSLLVILIGIQFLRPGRNIGTAEGCNDIAQHVTVPEDVAIILRRSCYDCHSNKTVYPWYADISPVSLIIAAHIRDGKSELNFSDLGKIGDRKLSHKLRIIADQVDKHKMPLGSYTLIHKDALLQEKEVQTIKNWARLAALQIEMK